MAACPSCKRELPGEFPFCPFCGAALVAGAPAREERKVVTVVFCDLVGSTARAERLDPEDVLLLADRCVEADYHVQRRLYMPLILGSLLHDLGKVVNPSG